MNFYLSKKKNLPTFLNIYSASNQAFKITLENYDLALVSSYQPGF